MDRKLLIVETNADLREALDTLGSLDGWSVKSTGKWTEAWDWLVAWRPAAALVELCGPRWEAAELARRAHALAAHPPVFAALSNELELREVAGQFSGLFQVVAQKPVGMEILAQIEAATQRAFSDVMRIAPPARISPLS